MYSYDWDPSTGGYILNSTPLNFSKEPRPVYYKELDMQFLSALRTGIHLLQELICLPALEFVTQPQRHQSGEFFTVN